jgi:hypothetical protein
MALPVKLSFNTRTYQAEITDVSTSSSAYVPVVARGRVIAIYAVIHGTLTGTSVLTASIGATAITGGSIADVGTVAGTVSSCEPTAANVLGAGDYLKVATDGGSTNTVKCTVTFVVREF